MAKSAIYKEKWTLTFDPTLKTRVQKEAKKLHIYPVQLLETLVREGLNPYGLISIKNSLNYVDSIRKKSRAINDKSFLADLKKWQKN
jgi:hypothetical protein